MADPVIKQYGYVNSDEIIEFMKGVNPAFTVTDINPIFINASFKYMQSKMDEQLNIEVPIADTKLLLDGSGFNFVYSELIPILSVTSVNIVQPDGTKIPLITTGTNRNVWWDNVTGRIWMDELSYSDMELALDGTPLMFDEDDPKFFPKWPDCIELTGKFGTISNDLVKLIQLLLMLKNYTMVNPSVYHPDVIEERIGKYMYKMSPLAGKDGRLGIDQYIDKLFKQVFTGSELGMESI